MAEKTGMGTEPLLWIGDTRKQSATVKAPVRAPTPTVDADTNGKQPLSKRQKATDRKISEVQKEATSEVPKFETFEVKLSILLRGDQLEFLERLTREIMGNRGRDSRKERITKNTIVRACIDTLREIKFDTSNIPDEEELSRRMREKMGG